MSRAPEWWRSDVLARRLPVLRTRGRIADAVRAFFRARDFAEVETPALQVSPGMEPHLRPFATDLDEPFGEGQRRLYLHTSPEFAMKKLLAGGVERMFQLARVFRNGERADTHHPEFVMLEWYRAGTDYKTIMDDCDGLLAAVAAAAGTAEWRRGGKTCDASQPAERLSVAEAFRRHAGVDLFAASDIGDFKAAAERAGIACQDGDRWDDVFFRIFLDRIEPNLGLGRPTILYDYPASMAALARLKPGDARVAERFEVYVAGLELANAFSELTDAAEQRRRFEADNDLREKLYGARLPVDDDFLAAVGAMPPAAGIALGFDRMVMLATGATRIEDVLWAPVDTKGLGL